MWILTDDALPRERSKLGTKIVDECVTIFHSVKDPELGVIPVSGVRDITLIENGVLKELYSERHLNLNESNVNEPNLFRRNYRMKGGTSTIEDMIATTQRGFLITRLSNPNLVDRMSVLSTGVTRDGLWLIEDGKVTKAVRNFRFTESPIFALNNLEELGQAERVFHPHSGVPMFTGLKPQIVLSQVIVPSIKVRDTLRLCLKKFSVSDVDYENYEEYADWITIFYDADRDEDSDSIIENRLASAEWSKDDNAGLHSVLVNVLEAISRGKELRWDTYIRVANLVDSAGDQVPWMVKVRIYGTPH